MKHWDRRQETMRNNIAGSKRGVFPLLLKICVLIGLRTWPQGFTGIHLFLQALTDIHVSNILNYGAVTALPLSVWHFGPEWRALSVMQAGDGDTRLITGSGVGAQLSLHISRMMIQLCMQSNTLDKWSPETIIVSRNIMGWLRPGRPPSSSRQICPAVMDCSVQWNLL